MIKLVNLQGNIQEFTSCAQPGMEYKIINNRSVYVYSVHVVVVL